MKLICYPVSGTPPRIRPAPATRQWMDDTPDRFANRCLPLSIANAAGWEILNPVAFSAVWNGSDGKDGVSIESDGGPPLAISHFGCGILTFHVTGLFRSSDNAVLWVGGSPNRLKDGIQPLTGVVETGWSPYTFTMNWRFTRADHPVHFERDEPFCFFFPLDLDAMEAVAPEFQTLSERSDLGKNYRAWTGSRDSFNADLQVPGSDAAQSKWQKVYHQGICPDGTKAPGTHRTKVRLKRFGEGTPSE